MFFMIFLLSLKVCNEKLQYLRFSKLERILIEKLKVVLCPSSR